MTERKRENCIIHCRVSTAKQAKEGDSLEAQEIIGRGVASRNDWRVLRVFHEPYSGRKDQRPLISDIVAFIKRSPKPVHHYIFKGIDRLTRAGVVEYERLKGRIERLGVVVVDSYGLIQPKRNTLEHLGFEYDWSIYSPSEAAELLEAHRGKQEVRDILTRMIGAEIKLTQDGYKVRQPADGYINKRVEVEGKKRVIEVADPERAPYFVEMFRLRAEGHLSDKQIARRVSAMGYRTKRYRRWDQAKNRIIGYTKPKPLSVKRLQEIIKRPIYCGVRVEKWTDNKPIRTRYPGLVSIATFNRANRGKVHIEEHADDSLAISYGGRHTPVRLKNNPLYPYKNVILCPRCRQPFLGSASRGKAGKHYPAYHCNRGHYLRIPKDDFEEAVDGYLETLRLSGIEPGGLEAALLRAWERRRDEIEACANRVRENVQTLRTAQDATVESLVAATDGVVREKLETRIVELEEQIARANDGGLQGEDVSREDIRGFVTWVNNLMEHPLRFLKDPSNIERQRTTFEIVFTELPTFEQINNGTPDLAPFFGLMWLFDEPESVSVRSHGFDWNTVQESIMQWKRQIRHHREDRTDSHGGRSA